MATQMYSVLIIGLLLVAAPYCLCVEEGSIGNETRSNDKPESAQEVVKSPENATDEAESIEIKRDEVSQRDIYYSGFVIKRREQISAVKSLLKIPDYSKLYKIVDLLLDKIFKVMQDARLVIAEAAYYPGDEFPEDTKIQHALGNVVENVAFFGDIVLRLPEVAHKIFDRQNEWRVLASWAISFANDTLLFTGGNARLLNLMAQELGVIPLEPNYINPYVTKPAESMPSAPTEKSKSKKKKSEKKRGPRLGGSGRQEL